MRKPCSCLGSSQFRLQWPVLDRLQVLLASSFSYLGSTLSSSGPFALLRRLCPSCFLPPLQPISKCSTWVNLGTVSFLRCFLSVFSPFFTHFSVQGTQHWRPRVYFRVGFSPCASHFDDIRDMSKSPVPPCCSNGPSVNRRCCGCRFSRIPQPCSSCGAPSIGVSGLDFSELFLQPRAQLSTSICVPHPRWHQGCARRSSRGSSHQITTQESEVSIFPETSHQPGASYKSP